MCTKYSELFRMKYNQGRRKHYEVLPVYLLSTWIFHVKVCVAQCPKCRRAKLKIINIFIHVFLYKYYLFYERTLDYMFSI